MSIGCAMLRKACSRSRSNPMTTNETLSPQQLEAEGKAAFQREEYEEAALSFEAAQTAFLAQDDGINAAEMANNRSVALLQAGQANAALEAVGDTPIYFAGLDDKRRQAIALGNKAAALAAMGDTQTAETVYWESARLLKEIGETDMRASVMQAISRLQLKTGRAMEAMASMQSGLDEVKKPSITQRLLKRLLRVPFRMLNPPNEE